MVVEAGGCGIALPDKVPSAWLQSPPGRHLACVECFRVKAVMCGPGLERRCYAVGMSGVCPPVFKFRCGFGSFSTNCHGVLVVQVPTGVGLEFPCVLFFFFLLFVDVGVRFSLWRGVIIYFFHPR